MCLVIRHPDLDLSFLELSFIILRITKKCHGKVCKCKNIERHQNHSLSTIGHAWVDGSAKKFTIIMIGPQQDIGKSVVEAMHSKVDKESKVVRRSNWRISNGIQFRCKIDSWNYETESKSRNLVQDQTTFKREKIKMKSKRVKLNSF